MVWGKQIEYMKYIKIHWCHMDAIFTTNHLIWKSQQCVRVHSQIMRYHTGNMYFRCFAKWLNINIPDQETYYEYSNTSPSISFHIYYLNEHCTTHGRLLLTDKKIFHKCKHDTVSEQSTKIYTKKKGRDDRDNHFKFSYKFLYSRNSDVGVSYSTCINTGYTSLWWLSSNHV